MSRTTNKAILVLVSIFVLGLLFIGMLLYQQQRKPLTNIEKQLVGYWLCVEVQEEDPGGGFTFSSDRTFHSNDQQFFGHWGIVSGVLRIEYKGERNWVGGSWLEKLRNGMRSQPLNTNQIAITFGDDDNSAELTGLNESDVTNLVRSNE